MQIHVIGAGIAGTFLARALLRRHADVTVWDDPAHPSASRAAAGLVNPVTGIRLARTWQWDRFFPAARRLFEEIGSELGQPVWQDLPIDRIFRTPEEGERWEKRATDRSCDGYVREMPPGPVASPHGGIRIVGGGWFDYGMLPRLLPSRVLRPERAEPSALEGTVVDCRGWTPEPGSFPLPWNPAKGEILTLRLPGWPEDRVLMRGVFTLPLGGGIFRVGATYEWGDLQPVPTAEGRATLLDALRAMGVTPGEILDARAGIRPILRGSRPAVGPHPHHPRQWIFNGLGSKAALMAPALAEDLAAWILGGAPILPEADARRFFP
jgi:glycine/D-amino acid oxidase-like deaminating enzyme